MWSRLYPCSAGRGLVSCYCSRFKMPSNCQLRIRSFGSEVGYNKFGMEVHPEVAKALAHGRPVVALETTIVTHGMPYPENLRTALSVEEVVRSNGVTPATIGVVDGKICIGSKSEMEKILNTFEGDDDVPVGSKAKKSVSQRPKQTSANQKSKGAVKAFQKKKAQEEADRVTKLLLAGLQDVTEAAPTATTNLHLSPSPGSKQSDHQKSPLPNQGENSLTHSPSTTLSPVIHLDGALNSPPPTRKDGSLSPDLFSSDTPLIQRADLPPMKRKRTETTEIIHSKRALLQETSTFSELDSENYNSYVALSPSTPRLSEHSTPDTGRLQPTPLQLSSLQEWMKRQFEQLNCKIDKNAKTIEELKTIIAKKKTKKLVSNGVSNGNDVECVIREEVPPLQDPLMVCCGQPLLAGKHVYLKLPTEAAVAEFHQLEGCPPKEPGKFALKLLSIFFCDEELSESNCTKAEGRKLLDQNILLGIKYHTNFKFPVSPGEETKRWQSIVTKNLNTKCRAARRKLRLNEDQKKVPSLVQVEGNEEQS